MKLALPNGLTFYGTSDDVSGMARVLRHEVFVESRYRRPGFEIGQHDTVVDVGANMGMFTLWAATQAPRGRIVAVEPTPAVDSVRMNVQRNGLDHVDVVHAAVGADGTTSDFVYYPGMSGLSLKSGFRRSPLLFRLLTALHDRSHAAPVTVKAPCRSLGTILRASGIERVDFLKVDCEGGEYDLFRTMGPDDWRKIEKVAMEFHQFHPSHDYRFLLETLRQNGFRAEVRRNLLERLFGNGEIWAARPRRG